MRERKFVHAALSGGKVHDRLGKLMRRFLRQVVADPAGQGLVRVTARQLTCVGSWIGMSGPVRIALQGDGGHADDGRLRQPRFERIV